MKNIYQASESVIDGLRRGHIPEGSIIRVQHPSGNSEGVRVHGWDDKRNKLIGCSMGWDNHATETYDLSTTIVSVIEVAK